jgi:ABC-type branched-subunit amino acid transport system ATPase component
MPAPASPHITAAIQVRDLRKSYAGRNVVDGIDLCIPRGEFFGLLGPNGAGKTTTLRMLLGLTPADSGRVELLGQPMPERERELRARLGDFYRVHHLRMPLYRYRKHGENKTTDPEYVAFADRVEEVRRSTSGGEA